MVRQISISDELAEFLDHFRKEWGNPGTLSYTKTIERFIRSTNEDEIIRREIVKTFKDLQFRMPKSFFHSLEVIKASVIAMVGWEEDQRGHFCENLHIIMQKIKENTRLEKKPKAQDEADYDEIILGGKV